MPHADPDVHRQYASDYQRKRYAERLAMARERLGGECAWCGTTEDLQFDHVDPATKVCNVSEATNWSLERFLSEVDKCQLLCDPCHHEKSQANGEQMTVEHGYGAKGKYNCKCDLCRARCNEYMREYKRAAQSSNGRIHVS